MFLWFIYLFSCLCISYLITNSFSKKTKTVTFFLLLGILLTPENMGMGGQNPSPAFLSFVFNSIFEQNISLRILRPLTFGLPLSIMLALIFLKIKKRFSQN